MYYVQGGQRPATHNEAGFLCLAIKFLQGLGMCSGEAVIANHVGPSTDT